LKIKTPSKNLGTVALCWGI